MTRTLIYIPIVHTDADMGAMSESLQQVYVKHYGRRKWTQRTLTVERIWKEIERKILALPLDYTKLKLYQDGLPKCGQELEIAKSVAVGGSTNFQLLVRLVEKGAQLIGTEDPDLLIQEYNRLRNALDNLAGSRGRVQPKKSVPASRASASVEGFVPQRDKYIAARIDETLRDGETGILFMGVIHRANEMLPSDIRISYLLPI
ncbi:MAG: hypothetical protein NTZ35_09540 [Ignavibacteriales bacterium]|nr:hypothetical protein [Ignavibacteriales bacterium]